MCAAARRAVVIEPRVGIIGSRACIHVWFIFFPLIYNSFTSCARSLLCPHLSVVHPAAFPGLFRPTAEHDLLLTLASTAWESGRCSWVSSSHKHLGWCSGVRTSPVYLTPGLEELETGWELRNWGWSQKNQSHQGNAVSSFKSSLYKPSQ